MSFTAIDEPDRLTPTHTRRRGAGLRAIPMLVLIGMILVVVPTGGAHSKGVR